MLEAERARKAAFYLIESDEKALAADEAALRKTRARLQSLQGILVRDERQNRLELDRLQTDLKTLEAQLSQLQQKKSTHFARIGHELADVGIAPMNQPGILTRVLALREKITDLDFQLVYSLGQSQPASRPIHLVAFVLFTLLVTGAIFLVLLASWHGLKLLRG